MEKRELGKSGISVSVVGLGTWQFANAAYWGDARQEQVDRIVHEAIDLGINYLDTAMGYGESEELLGRSLKGRREQVIISSKTSGKFLKKKELRKAVDQSLKYLRTDYIDLYIMHWPNREIPAEETLAAFNEELDKGRIRSIGVSNFCVPDLEAVIPHGEISSNQLPYSLFWRMIEREIVPACEKHRVSVVAYSPLAQGLLSGKFRGKEDIPDSGRLKTRLFRDDALKVEFEALGKMDAVCRRIGATPAQVSMAWLLRQPGVASVIPGARSLEQLRDNAGAAGVNLSAEDVEELTRISDPVLEALGADPDMWDMGRYI